MTRRSHSKGNQVPPSNRVSLGETAMRSKIIAVMTLVGFAFGGTLLLPGSTRVDAAQDFGTQTVSQPSHPNRPLVPWCYCG
jgi:hypothetical protein